MMVLAGCLVVCVVLTPHCLSVARAQSEPFHEILDSKQMCERSERYKIENNVIVN